MKKFIVEKTTDIAEFMYDKMTNGCIDAMFVGLYEDAVEVLKHLISYDETMIFHVEIEPEDYDWYDKEYYISLDRDLNIWCNKAYYAEKDTYLYTESECTLIADDCNYKILEHIGCDDIYMVSYDLSNKNDEYDYHEDQCDGKCCGCGLDCRPDPEEDIEEKHKIGTESNTVNSRVVVDKDGKIKGFEKSWSTQSGNMTYYGMYSHYSNDQEMIKKLMENFDIRI